MCNAYLKTKSESEITNPALAIVRDIKEDDNPILCFFKLKKQSTGFRLYANDGYDVAVEHLFSLLEYLFSP
jgi:hypothetical protein